jgi:hypothetical protein
VASSANYSFRVPSQPPHDTVTRIAAVASPSAATAAYLAALAAQGGIGLVLHAAGGLGGASADLWDEKISVLQPAAALVPWMSAPGEAEAVDSFSLYRARMQLPRGAGANSPLFYSFDYQHVHVAVLASELSMAADAPLTRCVLLAVRRCLGV